MHDMTGFEARLGDVFGRYADRVDTAFDPMEIAASVADAAAAPGRRGVRGLLAAPGRFGPVGRALLLVALLALIVLAGILSSASRRELPPPFGPAANGLIAYASGGDAYVGDPRTGEVRALLATSRDEQEPLWSPDGTRVAVISTAADGDRIVVVRPDGSGAVTITPEPLQGVTWNEWSPDAKSMLVVSGAAGSKIVSLIPVDGSGQARVLLEAPDVAEVTFRPPDGRELLARVTTPQGVTLLVLRAEGGPSRELVPTERVANPFSLRFARYSPDGTRVAFQRWIPAEGEMGLFIVNAEAPGAGPQRILDAADTWFTGLPAWSPDGKKLVFLRLFRGPAGPTEENGRYGIVASDGSGPITDAGPPLAIHGGQIQWSPDGSELLLRLDAADAPGEPQILIDARDGTWRPAPWSSNSWPSWQRLSTP